MSLQRELGDSVGGAVASMSDSTDPVRPLTAPAGDRTALVESRNAWRA